MPPRVLALLASALLALGVLWAAAAPSSGSGTCGSSVDADAVEAGGGDPQVALRDALSAAAAEVGVCSGWRVELAGTFALTSPLEWALALPLHLIGPEGATARLEAVPAGGGGGGGGGGGSGLVEHRILTADTSARITLERLVLTGGDVSRVTDGPPFAEEGGAVFADDLWLIDAELIGNAAAAGGAVSTIDLRAVRTSFVSNEAETGFGEGGAVIAAGDVELENVTFVGNAALAGGALWMDRAGDLTATFVTFTGNSGVVDGADVGGADLHLAATSVVGVGEVTLRGVLFGGTAAGSDGPTCAGDVTFDASGPALTWVDTFESVRSVAGVPRPASCGGPADAVIGEVTFTTVAFLTGTSPLPVPEAGSASIDRVSCGAGWPGGDQRGVTRPQGERCDAGAVELVVAVVPEPEEEEEEVVGGSETTTDGEVAGAVDDAADDGVEGDAVEGGGGGAVEDGRVEGGAGGTADGGVAGAADRAVSAVVRPVPTSIPAGGGGCADGCPPPPTRPVPPVSPTKPVPQLEPRFSLPR